MGITDTDSNNNHMTGWSCSFLDISCRVTCGNTSPGILPAVEESVTVGPSLRGGVSPATVTLITDISEGLQIPGNPLGRGTLLPHEVHFQ